MGAKILNIAVYLAAVTSIALFKPVQVLAVNIRSVSNNLDNIELHQRADGAVGYRINNGDGTYSEITQRHLSRIKSSLSSLQERDLSNSEAHAQTRADEAQAVVIDVGSHTTKAGLAGDEEPRAVFPTVVARPREQCVTAGVAPKAAFVGDEAVSKRGILTPTKPVEDGVVTNWEDYEEIIRHIYDDELQVAAAEHPLLMAEAPLDTTGYRAKVAQLSFGTFNVPKFYMAIQAVLSIYASGNTTGVVLDSGKSATYVVPVREGYALPSAIAKLDVAGWDVTGYLMKILTERGYSFTTFADSEIARDIKEKLSYVAGDFDDEMLKAHKTSSLVDAAYELPNRQVITIGNERFRNPEIMFKPSLFGRADDGIHQMLYEAIMKCDTDIREALFGNIVLSGGNTMFEGMAERLTKELEALAPAMRVQVVASPKRKHFVWIGGSILASLASFQAKWVSKQQYDDSGPSVLES